MVAMVHLCVRGLPALINTQSRASWQPKLCQEIVIATRLHLRYRRGRCGCFLSLLPHTQWFGMRHFIDFPLFALLLSLLIATLGCQDSGSSTVSKTDASSQADGDHDHDHGDHDHGDHDHGDHDHDHDAGSDPSLPPTGSDQEQHQDPETYDEAVTELVATQKAIAEAFAAGNQDDAHGPLHDVGHLLGNTETLVEKSDMDDDTKKKLSEAIEQLFASYGAVDEKMHNSEKGKDYSDVSEQIENAISELKAQVKISKE